VRAPASGGFAAAAPARPTPQTLVELVAQTFARLELRLLRGGNLDLLARARVAAFRRGALRDREGAEPDETNLAAPLQCAGDRLEHRVYRFVGSGFRQISLTGDGIDEFVSVQVLPPRRLSE